MKNLVKIFEYIDAAPDPEAALKKVMDRIDRVNRRNFLRGGLVTGVLVGAVLLDKFYPIDKK